MHMLRGLLLLLLPLSVASGQVISIGPEGGLTFLAGPAEITRPVSDIGLGFDRAPAVGLHIELGWNDVPFRLTSRMLYMPMSGSGTLNNPLYAPNAQGDWKTSQDMFLATLGTEWFFGTGILKPYARGELLLTSSGKTRVDVTNNGITTRSESGGGTQWGFGIGAGLQTALHPGVTLDLSTSYLVHAPFASQNDRHVTTLPITLSVLFTL